ncbi:MAG TPA: aminopeptidase P N-terminal domain-containing protein [Gemmatimonadales bacterium]|nr:aminopeptidase P N-terminal domain-containing protein [Gemmatimonadales bacterium]
MKRALAVLSCALVPSLLAAQAGSPAGPVPVARLEARRAALAHRLGTGVAILRSSVERNIEGDYAQDSDYREDNDFFYLTGAEAPESWLVLVARDSAPTQVILYLPPRDTVTPYTSEQWVGPRLNPGPAATALTGIKDVRSAERAEREISGLVFGTDSTARRGVLYLKPGMNQEDSPFLRDSVAAVATAGGIRLGNLSQELAPLRLIKDDDELARLRKAIALTTQAERNAMAALRPDMYEYELEALIEYTFRRGGAERVGFPSIVGSGPNSVLLHYDKNRRRMEAGDLVVMDIGAEFGYLTADVTRTAPVSGTYTPRQRAIYELVLRAQQTAIDSVRPGMDIPRLNQIARAYLRAHSDTLCGRAATCDKYFVHGLSHWLGMDVHDVGDVRTPLAPGMVLTVEPGVYLPAEALGVRIEDDVLVTRDGHEVLSAAAPKRPDEIEAVVRRGRQP